MDYLGKIRVCSCLELSFSSRDSFRTQVLGKVREDGHSGLTGVKILYSI